MTTPQPTPRANLFRQFALVSMVACVTFALAQLIAGIFPQWPIWVLIGGSVLVTLETQLTQRYLQTHPLTGLEVLRFRLAEYGVFFVVFKLAHLAARPWATVWAELQNWPREPFLILDGETILHTILAVLISFAITDSLQDLDTLGEPLPRGETVTPRERLTTRFYWGGALVMLASGLARVGLEAAFDLSRASLSGIFLNVLLYFGLGFLVLGQAQLTTLLKHWQTRGLAVATELVPRWRRYTLALLGLAALAAFVLPTRYAFDPLTIIGTLVYWFSALTLLVFWLLLLPLNYLMAFVFGRRPAPPPPPPNLVPPVIPTTESLTQTGLQFLGSIVFWVIVIGMFIYLLLSYFRDRPEFTHALKQLKVFETLRRWWSAFRHRLSGFAEAVGLESLRETVAQFFQRRRSAPFNFFRLGAASPREQIVFYYLSLLRRAREQGFPRHPTQTPAEYAPTLTEHLPEAQPDIEALTAAFVEARYSPHPVDKPQVAQAQTLWSHLRAALQKHKQQN